MDIINELNLIIEVLPKILVATICGAIVGLERELKHKDAGLRTNILICVGSAIFTIGAIYITNKYNFSDPSRIVSTIVTGVGFLGGGAIMRDKDKIVGLTTASFIWVISAIGILCGMGFTLMPIGLTLGMVAISYIFKKLNNFIKKDD